MPEDRQEVEADRMADQIMRIPRESAAGDGPRLGGSLADTAIDTPTLARKEATGVNRPPTSIPALGAGRPLSDPVRSYFEPRFGKDFSHVAVHTGKQAHRAAQQLNARAFTLGSSIAFAEGEFAPGTADGDRLLAHELTHVVQQRSQSDQVIQRDRHRGPAGVRETVVVVPWNWDYGFFYRRLVPAVARSRSFQVRAASLWQPAHRPIIAFHSRHGRRHPLGLENGDPVAVYVSASIRRNRLETVSNVTVESDDDIDRTLTSDDWDFTPAEFGALRSRGRSLRFAPGSGWFPAALQRNVIATLNAVLDPARRPSATAGVNVRDFYHGHVVVPRSGPRPASIAAADTAYERERERRYAGALGGRSFGDVTARTLPAFTQAVRATLPLAGRLSAAALRQPGAAVIYHTFETNMPSGMGVGDPRRNWKTPLSTNQPSPYSPPDPRSASSYSQNYYHVFQFAFLVDHRGRIHVRPGSTRELSTVTGRP
jgi:hypothetical protein